jgi:hypothetical protein
VPVLYDFEIVLLDERLIASRPAYRPMLIVFIHGFFWNNNYRLGFSIMFSPMSRKMITEK